MPRSYDGWIICPCGFVGDGFWRENDDNTYEFFCTECRKTTKITKEEYDS